MAHSLWRALGGLAAARLERPHVREVESRGHLRWLVTYTLQQVDHHGIDAHPALFSGSCFADLVAARRIPGFEPRLREALPRVSAMELCQAVRLPITCLEPASNASIRAAGAARLAGAAAAALAVGPELCGRTAGVVAARRGTVQVGSAAGISRAELSWALGITPRAVGLLAGQPADPALTRAIRVRSSLEEAVVGARRRGS